MRILADENGPRSIVVWLRGDGHDVLYAAESRAQTSDDDLLSEAEDQGYVVLAEDTDFGDLIFRDKRNSHGVILLRMGEKPVADRIGSPASRPSGPRSNRTCRVISSSSPRRSSECAPCRPREIGPWERSSSRVAHRALTASASENALAPVETHSDWKTWAGRSSRSKREENADSAATPPGETVGRAA